MAKLYLKFEQAVLKEFALTQGVVTIGRLPDNLIQVDNLAVSGHHAKIYWDMDHYALEDNNSLNGTFVNNRRISKVVLKDGDEVLIGKHTVLFKGHEDAAHPGADLAVPMVPTLEATVVLDTRKAKEMLAHQPTTPAGGAPAAAVAPAPAKEHTGVFRILAGKTDQSEYVLAGKLTVVGKSAGHSLLLAQATGFRTERKRAEARSVAGRMPDVAVEPGDCTPPRVERVLRLANAVPLVGINDEASRHVHRL